MSCYGLSCLKFTDTGNGNAENIHVIGTEIFLAAHRVFLTIGLTFVYPRVVKDISMVGPAGGI